MKEGLPSPSPRPPPPPQGHLGGRTLSDTASALSPMKSSSPQTSVWGESCWGRRVGVLGPTDHEGVAAPFPSPGLPAAQPRPLRDPGCREAKVSLTLGGGRGRRGSWPGSTPKPRADEFRGCK